MLKEFEALTAKMSAANNATRDAVNAVKDFNLKEIAASEARLERLKVQLAPLPAKAKALRLQGDSRAAREIINTIEDLNFDIAKENITLAELKLARAGKLSGAYQSAHTAVYVLGQQGEQLCYSIKEQADRDLQEVYRLHGAVPDYHSHEIAQYSTELKAYKARLEELAATEPVMTVPVTAAPQVIPSGIIRLS